LRAHALHAQVEAIRSGWASSSHSAVQAALLACYGHRWARGLADLVPIRYAPGTLDFSTSSASLLLDVVSRAVDAGTMLLRADGSLVKVLLDSVRAATDMQCAVQTDDDKDVAARAWSSIIGCVTVAVCAGVECSVAWVEPCLRQYFGLDLIQTFRSTDLETSATDRVWSGMDLLRQSVRLYVSIVATRGVQKGIRAGDLPDHVRRLVPKDEASPQVWARRQMRGQVCSLRTCAKASVLVCSRCQGAYCASCFASEGCADPRRS
jgi:hypothetical protein